MRVRAAQTRRLDFLLSEPYTIAYETYDRATNVFLRLEASNGLHGMGCGSPAPEVTGETVEDCVRALDAAAAALPGADLEHGATVWADLSPLLEKAPAAGAAVDMALLDLQARAAGLPLYRFLGAVAHEAVTSVTLGIEPLEETRRRARHLVGQGYRALKIKGGRSAAEDIERIHAVRAEVGVAIDLRFDANQGYGAADAVRFALATAADRVELLEQPTASSDPEALHQVTRELAAARGESNGLPLVMADESCVTVRDAMSLAGRGSVDSLNLKLMKIGGLQPATRADEVAAAHGMPTMVSCMDESELAISAGLHWALSRANVRWVDLDGHLDLLDDPAAGTVQLRDGLLRPGPGPGLGVDFSL